MELQVQDLISAIKKDGVDAAQAEAERILAEAKQQAAEIVSAAKEEAERIRLKSEKETEIMKDSVKTAAEHAKRDAVLSFKNSVREEFEKILSADVSKSLEPGLLAKLIVAAIGGDDPALYIAEVKQVSEGLKGTLAEKIRGGLEIKANPNVRAGFRLAAKDGSGYFDCTDEAITQMLMPFFADFVI